MRYWFYLALSLVSPVWGAAIDQARPADLVAGDDFFCLLDEEGVKCWGAGVARWQNGVVRFDDLWGNGQVKMPVLKFPKRIWAAGRAVCALDEERVKCWGEAKWLKEAAIPERPERMFLSDDNYCLLTETLFRCAGYYAKPIVYAVPGGYHIPGTTLKGYSKIGGYEPAPLTPLEVRRGKGTWEGDAEWAKALGSFADGRDRLGDDRCVWGQPKDPAAPGVICLSASLGPALEVTRFGPKLQHPRSATETWSIERFFRFHDGSHCALLSHPPDEERLRCSHLPLPDEPWFVDYQDRKVPAGWTSANILEMLIADTTGLYPKRRVWLLDRSGNVWKEGDPSFSPELTGTRKLAVAPLAVQRRYGRIDHYEGILCAMRDETVTCHPLAEGPREVDRETREILKRLPIVTFGFRLDYFGENLLRLAHEVVAPKRRVLEKMGVLLAQYPVSGAEAQGPGSGVRLFLLNALRPLMESIETEYFDRRVRPFYLKSLAYYDGKAGIRTLADLRAPSFRSEQQGIRIAAYRLLAAALDELRQAAAERGARERMEEASAVVGIQLAEGASERSQNEVVRALEAATPSIESMTTDRRIGWAAATVLALEDLLR